MEQQLQKLTQAILARGKLLKQLEVQCAAIQASVEEMKPKPVTPPAQASSSTPPAQASSLRSLATGELDAPMLTDCSMNCPDDDTNSRTSAFMPDVASGPPSTAALIDVAITNPEPTNATILVCDGPSDLTPTPSGAAVHSIDLGDEHVPNLYSYQLGARKVFDRMRGTDGISYGFSTNGLILTACGPDKSSTAGIAEVDRVTRRRERAHRVLILARLENSCGALEFRQPWPPPTQVDVMCSGVELCPMSWLSCKDYRGGVKWMPPWSPPVPRRMLIRGKGFCPAINSTEMKDVATENFQRIRDAYEILSDENKRQIYDIYGMEGLNSSLERGPKLNQPEEIKEQLERLRRRKEDLRQVLFHVRCNEVVRRWQFIQGIDSILGVDCMNLEEVHWKAYMEDKTIKWIYVLEYISKVVTVALKQLQKQHGGLTLECLSEAAKELLIIANISGPQYLDGNGIRRGKGMSSEVQLPVSKRNTVVVGGNLVVNGTAGTGAAITMLRHQLSSVSSIKHMATAGPRSLTGIQSFGQILPHSIATSGLAISLRDGSINLSNAWTHQLSENAAGEVKFGTNSFGASAHYTNHFSSKSRGRIAGRVGSTALDIDVVGGWRYMFGFGAPMTTIMAIDMWTLPPSPRWLLLRAVQEKGPVEDNKKKAMHALRKLRGRSASDKVLADEIGDTLVSIKAAYVERQSEGNIWEIFEGASLKAFIIGGGLVLFQQITGQPSVLYYATSILQIAGFTAASEAARVSILIGLFKLLMACVAVFQVVDLGRRPLLIGGEFQWPPLPLLSTQNLNVTQDGCNLGKDGMQETDAKWCTPGDWVYSEVFSAAEAPGVWWLHLLIILQQKRGGELEICMDDLQVTSTIRNAEHEIHVSPEAINYVAVWKQARDVSSYRYKLWIYPGHTWLISMDSCDSFSEICVNVAVFALEGSWMQQEGATHDDDLTLVALEHLGSFCTIVRVLRTALLQEQETIGNFSEERLQVESSAAKHGWCCYFQNFTGGGGQILVAMEEVQRPWDPRGCELNSDGFMIAA